MAYARTFILKTRIRLTLEKLHITHIQLGVNEGGNDNF